MRVKVYPVIRLILSNYKIEKMDPNALPRNYEFKRVRLDSNIGLEAALANERLNRNIRNEFPMPSTYRGTIANWSNQQNKVVNYAKNAIKKQGRWGSAKQFPKRASPPPAPVGWTPPSKLVRPKMRKTRKNRKSRKNRRN